MRTSFRWCSLAGTVRFAFHVTFCMALSFALVTSHLLLFPNQITSSSSVFDAPQIAKRLLLQQVLDYQQPLLCP